MQSMNFTIETTIKELMNLEQWVKSIMFSSVTLHIKLHPIWAKQQTHFLTDERAGFDYTMNNKMNIKKFPINIMD